MSQRPEPGVFLERRSYRRRRMLDGLKMLPILGAWLFMLPLMWPDGGGGAVDAPARSMSSALIYIFGTWLVMILCGWTLVAALSRLRDVSGKDAAPEASAEDGGPIS